MQLYLVPKTAFSIMKLSLECKVFIINLSINLNDNNELVHLPSQGYAYIIKIVAGWIENLQLVILIFFWISIILISI